MTSNLISAATIMDSSSPFTSTESNPNLILLQGFLTTNPSVKFIRFQFIDLSAFVRVRLTPIGQALRLATHGSGIGVPSPVASSVSIEDSFLFELVQSAKDQLIPD